MIKKIKWSLRRISLNIHKNALVLEVGSGGNPYPRSNVLLDAYEETRERHWEDLIHDRPTILSFGENLPFKDKSFDFVIAAHVLEHTPYPDRFLSEIQRVGRAGYIETPDAFMERINPYKDHRLEITVRDNNLLIRKKKHWIQDAEVNELYEQRAKMIIAEETIPRHPEEFHTRYFWSDKINYTIVNPEVDADWSPPSAEEKYNGNSSMALKVKFRLLILAIIRHVFSQRTRNSRLDILSLLKCPKCQSEEFERHKMDYIFCKSCDTKYKNSNNLYYFN